MFRTRLRWYTRKIRISRGCLKRTDWRLSEAQSYNIAAIEEQRSDGGAQIGVLEWRITWDELERAAAGERMEWMKEPKRQ